MTASIKVGPHLGAGIHNEQEAVKRPGRDDQVELSSDKKEAQRFPQ